eukprot:116902_1
MAAIHDQPQVIELLHILKKRGVLSYDQLSHKDKDGATAYHYCLRSQNIKTLKMLLKFNRRGIHTLDNKKQSPILWAIRYGDINFFNKLESHGIGGRIIRWSTFIFPVCIEGNISILQWLLTKITPATLIKLKNGDISKRTPIHFVCLYGRKDCIPLLIDYGVNVNDTDYKGRTGAFFAACNGYVQCLLSLQSYGADFSI